MIFLHSLGNSSTCYLRLLHRRHSAMRPLWCVSPLQKVGSRRPSLLCRGPVSRSLLLSLSLDCPCFSPPPSINTLLLHPGPSSARLFADTSLDLTLSAVSVFGLSLLSHPGPLAPPLAAAGSTGSPPRPRLRRFPRILLGPDTFHPQKATVFFPGFPRVSAIYF